MCSLPNLNFLNILLQLLLGYDDTGDLHTLGVRMNINVNMNKRVGHLNIMTQEKSPGVKYIYHSVLEYSEIYTCVVDFRKRARIRCSLDRIRKYVKICTARTDTYNTHLLTFLTYMTLSKLLILKAISKQLWYSNYSAICQC